MRWEDHEDARHIHLEGELDHEACEDIGAAFHDIVGDAKRPVVVHLEKVPFVSSKGIWLLLESRSRLKREGRQLFVRGLSPHVRKTFETVGVFKAAPEWDA
jgi:anti-anti-sigma factor